MIEGLLTDIDAVNTMILILGIMNLKISKRLSYFALSVFAQIGIVLVSVLTNIQVAWLSMIFLPITVKWILDTTIKKAIIVYFIAYDILFG